MNVINNFIKEYDSIHNTAKDLNVSHSTIRDYVKTGKFLRKVFLIKRIIN